MTVNTLQKKKEKKVNRRFVWASGSHIGLLRPGNQDLIHPSEGDGQDNGPLLVAVADGMGGLPHGALASRLAIEAAVPAEGTVEERVLAANQAVFYANHVLISDDPGMATTLTVAEVLPDGTVNIGHLGDSRAYLADTDGFRQVTRDHSWGQEKVDSGKLTPEEVKYHLWANAITRGVGFGPSPKVDVFPLNLVEGDRLLLCSDGLTNMVSDDRIADLLRQGTPSDAVKALIKAANEAGGHDNISVVVVEAC